MKKIIKLERAENNSPRNVGKPNFRYYARLAEKGSLIEVSSNRDLDSLYHAMRRFGIGVCFAQRNETTWLVTSKKYEEDIAPYRPPNMRRLGKDAALKKKVFANA